MDRPNSPRDMLKIMMEKIVPKTGKTFPQWVEVARASGIDRHKALTDHMKKTHGLNHNEAQWVAWGVTDPTRVDQYDRPTDLVEDLYSGKKAHLRPIHDSLIDQGTALAGDVDVVVCKTYSSLRNRAQFAVINPRTQKAVDLELALPPGTEAAGRLETFKSNNPKLTHRIRIKDAGEIDGEVMAALGKAAEHVRG